MFTASVKLVSPFVHQVQPLLLRGGWCCLTTAAASRQSKSICLSYCLPSSDYIFPEKWKSELRWRKADGEVYEGSEEAVGDFSWARTVLLCIRVKRGVALCCGLQFFGWPSAPPQRQDAGDNSAESALVRREVCLL